MLKANKWIEPQIYQQSAVPQTHLRAASSSSWGLLVAPMTNILSLGSAMTWKKVKKRNSRQHSDQKFYSEAIQVAFWCFKNLSKYSGTGIIDDYRAKKFQEIIQTLLPAISILTPSKETRNSVFILRLCSCSPSFLSQSKESTSSEKSKFNTRYKTPTWKIN